MKRSKGAGDSRPREHDLDASIRAHHAYKIRCQEQANRDDVVLTVKLVAFVAIAWLLGGLVT